MNLFMTVFVALLFVALTPGVLVSLPPGGSKLTVALFHGVVFALVYHFTHKAVWLWSKRVDGYDDMEAPPQMSGAPEGAMCKTSDQCLSGQCNDGICA